MSEEFLFPLEETHYRRMFGLSPSVYSRMCWCGIMVCDHSDIEPIVIKRLLRAGCDLVLYGKVNAYTIRITPETGLASCSPA